MMWIKHTRKFWKVICTMVLTGILMTTPALLRGAVYREDYSSLDSVAFADAASSTASFTYTVQRGDTLHSIADRFGVDVNQIIRDNHITNINTIYSGQKLLIRDSGQAPSKEDDTASGSTNYDTSYSGSGFSLNVKEADLRDVLSALAIEMDVSIIFTGEPVKVTFKIEDASPMKALELLLQSQDLWYIQDGSILVVGKTDKLQKDFFRQMVLTRFNLQYVSAANVTAMIDKLGIPLQKITLDQNPQVFWAQGVPQALYKVKELIKSVDLQENKESGKIPVDSAQGITAYDKLVSRRALISQLTGISQSSMHISGNISGDEANPQYVLWLDGSLLDIQKVKDMIAKIDNPRS